MPTLYMPAVRSAGFYAVYRCRRSPFLWSATDRTEHNKLANLPELATHSQN